MTFCRAGHTPLIFLPGPSAGDAVAAVLTPNGMVLGPAHRRRRREVRRAARGGALDARAGRRLRALHRRHHRGDESPRAICSATRASAASSRSTAISTPSELRERILREIEAFVGGADQHDDMTMILLKVDQAFASAEPDRRLTRVIRTLDDRAWSSSSARRRRSRPTSSAACSRRTASTRWSASDMSRTPFPLAAERAADRGRRPRTAPQATRHHRQPPRRGRAGARRAVRIELEPLERRIGYRFRDRGLLEHALTHRSRVHEDASGGVFDNESLEFLGDAVLGFVIADMLFREFPQHNEGQKSKLKASLVSAASLARLGEQHRARRSFLILGRGEEKTGGRRKHALHRRLLRGADRRHLPGRRHRAARGVHRAAVRDLIEEARRTGARRGVHRRLQVRAAGMAAVARPRAAGLPPGGEVGPAHRKVFDVEVLVDGEAARARRRARARRKRRRAASSRWRLSHERASRSRREPEFPDRIALQSISIIPQVLSRSASAARHAGQRQRGLGVRQPRQDVGVDFARDVVLGRRHRRGSAGAPRGAASDRRSCIASGATRSGRRPPATTGSPSSSRACGCRRSAISVSVSGSSSASTSRIAFSAP